MKRKEIEKQAQERGIKIWMRERGEFADKPKKESTNG